MNKNRGLIHGLMSLLSNFSLAGRMTAYKIFKEPRAFKEYSPEAQRLKIEKSSKKRAMRREKFAKTFNGTFID